MIPTPRAPYVRMEKYGRDDEAVGGLVGINVAADINNSQATGTVRGGTYVGGLVGYNLRGAINESFATGTVNGSYAEGGLVGYNDGSDGTAVINESYSTGAVSGSLSVGGFVGINQYAEIATCYWDTTTSGTDDGIGGGNISGLTGLTSKQLRSGLPPGFDPNIWVEKSKINNGFPYLIADPPLK